MRRFLLSFIGIILFVTTSLGQILQNTNINGVTKTNGKIYYKDSLFNGYLFDNYETGQIKYKYQVVDGITNGYYYQYYKDLNYNPILYRDSVKISTIQNKLESEKKILEQLIKDSLSSSRKISEYFIQEIKTEKKMASLKEKSSDGKLKGRNKKIYDSYILLLSNHQNIKSDIKSSSQKINDFDTLLNDEKSKKVFVPIEEFYYNQLNLIKNGTYASFYPNGRLKEVGEYQNNFKVGQWLTHYDNGKYQKVGSYDKGEEQNPEKGKIGEWYYYNTSGQPILIEKRDDNGSVISKVTNQYDSNGKLEKLITTNRSGINEGLYREYYSNGNLKIEGDFNSGLQNGPWVYYHENGKIKAKGNFINGDGSDLGDTGIPRNNRNGEWYFYEGNGIISSVSNWKNGMIHGQSKVFYKSSGKIHQESTYVNGKEHGQRKVFYENGNTKEETIWENGVLKSSKNFNSNGKITSSQEYSDSTQKNISATYYFESSGKINEKSTFVNGQEHGQRKVFYESSGKIYQELTFVNGKQHGQQKSFYENGKLKTSSILDTNSNVQENFIEQKQYDENGILTYHYAVSNGQWVNKLANTTNQANTTNTSSTITISKTEINKKYKCKCCKSTINGLTDGVDKSGGEYSDWYFNYYNKIYGSPEMTALYNNLPPILGGGEKMSSESFVYKMLRENFNYCSLKCTKVCAED